MGYSWLFMVDPSVLIVLSLASGTVFYGCYKSIFLFEYFGVSEEKEQEDNSNMKMKTAILLPIFGSIFLLLLFFLADWIFYILLAILSMSSTASLSYVVYPFFLRLCKRINWEKEYKFPVIGEISSPGILSLSFGLSFVICWLATKLFILTDILALCLAISALSFIRLPSLKIASVILPLFFIYDIFWVFLSEFIFKKNVMVTVAVSLPTLPLMIAIPKIFGEGLYDYVALGVGDMVLPGLFLCFLYRFDYGMGYRFKQGYFLKAWIGYNLGLVMTIAMVFVLDRAQPALLYLVPFTMVPTFFFGWRRGELKALWIGIEENEDNSTISMTDDPEALSSSSLGYDEQSNSGSTPALVVTLPSRPLEEDRVSLLHSNPERVDE